MASNQGGHAGPDRYLQTIVVNVDQPADHFIIRRIAQHATVDPRDKAGKIWVRNAAQYAQGSTESLVRAEGGTVHRIYGKNPSTIGYECEERALDVFSDQQKVRRNEYIEDVIEEDLGIAVANLMIEEEIDGATLLLDTSVYPAANTARMIDLADASGFYVGQAGATEHSDFLLAKQAAQRANRHRAPNALIIDVETVYALQRATDRSKIGDTQDQRVLGIADVLNGLSSRLGIPRDNIFVAKAQAADPDTEVWSDIWSNTEANNARGFMLFFIIEDSGAPRPVAGGVEINASLLLEVHEDLGAMPGGGAPTGAERAGSQPPGVESWAEKKPVPGQNTRATCSRALVLLNSGGAFFLRGTLAPAA